MECTSIKMINIIKETLEKSKTYIKSKEITIEEVSSNQLSQISNLFNQGETIQ